MRQPLIAGNWKMNGSKESVRVLLAGVRSGASAISRAELAVCPPFPYLGLCEDALQGTAVRLGAQNLCTETNGAYTGEISASMLADFGCRYVILGHSERRAYYGETDAIVARKIVRALDQCLTPILCVGETLEERQAERTETVVGGQIDAIVDALGIEVFGKLVIAYEPVWAIGTGMTATPEQAQAVHAFIRQRLAAHDAGVAAGLRILYGGSMKASNAEELLRQPDIDGGLIGGASLVAEDFLAIGAAADAVTA